MSTTDQPTRRPPAMIPTFTPPPAPDPTSDPTPPPTPAGDLTPARPGPIRRLLADGSASPDEIPTGRGARSAGRTETSSDGDVHKPTAAEATQLVIGLLAMVAVGAATVVRWRTKRKLRQPTKQQTHDIAAPLARIALDLSNLSWIGPNIIDAIKAATATGAYLNDGPLLLGADLDAGVPDDLQGAP